MAENYTVREYMSMIIEYGRAGENARAAARFYAERYPGRRHPDHNVILRVIQRGFETGNLLPNRQNAGAPAFHVNVEEQILRAFEENPSNSVRRVAHALGVSRHLVHRTLRRNGLHPYHYQRVQQLLPRDMEQRIYFCAGLVAQCERNERFPDRILWTDEATFTPNGVFNSRNHLIWSDENPHVVRHCAFQYRWAINVWAGITHNRIIGPYFLPPRLNGENYLEFLQNELPILLEDIPLQRRRQLIFQHDGAPAHFARPVREFLNAHYPDRWMGRGGPIIWPARSPDLNVLDFFVWGHIKNLVEHTRDGTEAEAREAILAAFNTITPDMAESATRNIIRRARLCLQERGGHFEQILH